MRVVHVVTLISDDGAFGGPLRVALNQVRELRDRGHDVELVAGWRGRGPRPQEIDGIPVRVFRARQLVPGGSFSGLFSPGLCRWLGSALSETDVVHVHAGRDLIALSALAVARRSACPAVVQTHGMIGVDRRLKTQFMDSLAVRRLVGSAARHLILTDREELELSQVLHGRPLKTTRVANGVNIPRRVSQVNPRRPSEVLYCARLHERKRPVTFVEMASLVSDPTAVFSMVGPDEGQLPLVQARIAELGLGNRVTYEGSLQYDQVLARMRSAAIYVLPSVDEPFPMSLLEAMSLGLPCICTDTCGISDEVRRAGAAIVTDASPASLAAAVDHILGDPERRANLGRRAEAMVRDVYLITAVVDTLECVYDSVMADV